MSWKRTVLAFVVLVLMIMALALDTQIIRNKIIKDVGEASLAHSVDISAVDQIYLKNNQGSMHLIRTTVGWRMKSPVDAPADPEIVETMLTNVTSARRRNEVESKNLAQYGLATPEVELSLVSDEGKFGDWGTSFGLHLGYESVYTGQVFGRYPGQGNVFTVGEHVKNTLLRSPMDFRRSRLFDVNTGDLNQYTALVLETLKLVPEDPAQNLNVERLVLSNDKGTWTISEPAEAKAEQSVVKEYFDRLGMLRAVSYVTETSDRPTSMTNALEALSSPTAVITLQGQPNTRPQQIRLAVAEGVEGPVYVAQRPGEPEVMVLTSETVQDMRRTPHYFRSRDLFSLKAGDVGLFTVQIARANPTALIRSDSGEWQLVGDPEFRINQEAVNSRLNSIANLRIEDYVDPNPVDLSNYGLDNPRIRFNMTNKDKSKTESLEIGSAQGEAGGLSYARSSMDKGVFTVRVTPDMLIIASQVAETHFAAVDPERLVRAEIDLDDKTYKLKIEDGEWKLLKPNQSTYSTLDMREATGLLTMINSLEYTEDLTASANTVIAPNEGPPLKVRFYGQDDTLLNEMNVTARINRTDTLVTNGRGRTFEVSTQDIDKIYAAAKNLVR